MSNKEKHRSSDAESAPHTSNQPVKQASFTAQYQGPLPLPAHLEEFERILPGAAERILSMVEKQSAHRQEIEKTVIRGDSRRSWIGLFVGGFLAMTCIVGGLLLASYGEQPAAGTTIATASVVGLAGVFVYGTHSRREERQASPIHQDAKR